MFKTKVSFDRFNVIQVCNGIYWSHLVYKQNIDGKKLFILQIFILYKSFGVIICHKYIHKHKYPVYAPN